MSTTDTRAYLQHLRDVADCDVSGLMQAEKSYGDSWKRRGGVGAAMMLARKWDRLEKRLGEVPRFRGDTEPGQGLGDRYDIFQHVRADERSEGVIDDIRDLRRYLMLVEAECVARGYPSAVSGHRDNPPAPQEASVGVIGVDNSPTPQEADRFSLSDIPDPDGGQSYVVGIILNKDNSEVLLIEKRRGPKLVVGNWNGPGGKVEAGENYRQALSREVYEETGLNLDVLWCPLGLLRGDNYRVAFAYVRVHPKILRSAYKREDEPVEIFDTGRLPENVMHNLRWMIPLVTDDAITKESRNLGVIRTNISV